MTLTLAGCGSGGGSTTTTGASATTAWADDVCGLTSAYKDSLLKASESVKGNLSKSGVQKAAENVKTATDTYVSMLKALDAPQTAAGKAAKTTLDSLAASLQHDANAIADASSGSPLEAVSVVSSTLVTAKDEVASAVDEIEKVDAKGELKTAFETAPSCVALSNGGTS